MKLLSFDIEISDVFELGKHEDIEKVRPFPHFRGSNGHSRWEGAGLVFEG